MGSIRTLWLKKPRSLKGVADLARLFFFSTFYFDNPTPAEQTILSVLEGDIAEGKEEKIACIQVDRNAACHLYAEGKIRLSDLKRMKADDEAGVLTVEGITFRTSQGERAYTLRIDANGGHQVATLDAEGKIV